MGGFPSGQRGQTVNLLQIASVVRIHLRPLIPSGIIMTRGGAARKLVGLITRRSQVQILSPLLRIAQSRCFIFHMYLAQIAQLVEQRTENPRVAGSIPALGTFLFPKSRPARSPLRGLSSAPPRYRAAHDASSLRSDIRNLPTSLCSVGPSLYPALGIFFMPFAGFFCFRGLFFFARKCDIISH